MSKRRVYTKKRYNQKSLHKEREYGFFWYSWIWHTMRPLMVMLASVVIVAGILSTGWNYVYSHYLMPVDPTSTEVQLFQVEKGASLSQIGTKLVEQKLLRNKGVFKYMVEFQGLSGKIQYGNYDLSPSMTVNEIISMLTTGDGKSKERQITIVPGWTVEDIAAYLVKQGALTDTKEFLALANDLERFQSDYYSLTHAAEQDDIKQRKYALEGYLAPDTYRVYTDASAESIIRILLGQTDVVLDKAFNQQDVVDEAAYDEDGNLITPEVVEPYDGGLTEDEVMIMASMVEKEARKSTDFAKVAAVFYNRLSKDMRLESDPTVKYTLGISKMALTEEELSTESKYNTYKIKGLPVGPICNPSPRAINAVLYPDLTYIEEGYLYFCSGDPSSTELIFSKTLEEHQAAVAQYRPLWVEYDRKVEAGETPAPTVSPEPTQEAAQ